MTDYELLPVCSQLLLCLLDHFVLGGDEALWDQTLCGKVPPFARESSNLVPFVLDELLILVLEFCFGKADSCPGLCICASWPCDPDCYFGLLAWLGEAVIDSVLDEFDLLLLCGSVPEVPIPWINPDLLLFSFKLDVNCVVFKFGDSIDQFLLRDLPLTPFLLQE